MNSYLTGRTQFVEVQHLDEKTANIEPFASSCKVKSKAIPVTGREGP
jgi:hypothetical protein